MVGWHHRLQGHEFQQAPGVGDGQGSLTCLPEWTRLGVCKTLFSLKIFFFNVDHF